MMPKSLRCQLLLLPLLLLTLALSSCGTLKHITDPGPRINNNRPDYAQTTNWLAQPKRVQYPVDVFYVYPTIYGEPSPANMEIQNEELRKTARLLLKKQAAVYSGSANLFAPFYRQVSMAMLNTEENMYENSYFRTGYEDVVSAFQYYLDHLNNGRPFILAGHSQGSMALSNLMRDFFNQEKLQNQLVAAYLIGYSITREDFKNFPWMTPATGPADTGTIISYNSQAPGTTGSPVLLQGAFCINPLNWQTDGTVARREQNLGAVFFNQDGTIEKEVAGYTGAQIDLTSGALITTPPETLNIGEFPKGVYHMYDYSLWFRNLEENVKLRIKAYLGKKQ